MTFATMKQGWQDETAMQPLAKLLWTLVFWRLLCVFAIFAFKRVLFTI